MPAAKFSFHWWMRQAAPYKRQLSQFNITALCTNRHLPIQLPISAGDTDLATELYSPVASIRWVAGPTVPIASTAEGDPSWRTHQPFVSELSFAARFERWSGCGRVARFAEAIYQSERRFYIAPDRTAFVQLLPVRSSAGGQRRAADLCTRA